MFETIEQFIRTDRTGNEMPDCEVKISMSWNDQTKWKSMEPVTKDKLMCKFFGDEWKEMGGKWNSGGKRTNWDECRSYNDWMN